MGMNCKMLKNESWIYLVCAVGALVTLVATMALGRVNKVASGKTAGFPAVFCVRAAYWPSCRLRPNPPTTGT